MKNVGGVPLPNEFILESGPFGHNGNAIILATQAGFAAVSTETISLADGKSLKWHLLPKDNSLYNCSRWSDIPVERWIHDEIPKARKEGANIIVSIGHGIKDVKELIPKFSRLDIQGIKLVSYLPDEMAEMVRVAKTLTHLPIWVKISGNWHNYLQVAKDCEKEGADAFVAIDTLGPVRMFSEDNIPGLSNEKQKGWVSGEAIHGHALYIVSELSEQTALPIIGTGGIMDSYGVARMRQAGATAFGICTAALLYGIDIVKSLHPPASSIEDADTNKPHPRIDTNLCINCGKCAQVCGYLALNNKENKIAVMADNCRGCGLCVHLCPNHAISI